MKKRLFAILLCMTLGSLPLEVLADENDYETRIAELESEVEDLRTEMDFFEQLFGITSDDVLQSDTDTEETQETQEVIEGSGLLDYEVVETEYCYYYFITNGYDYDVEIYAEALFYDEEGNVIDTYSDEAIDIETGSTYVFYFYKPTDSNGDVADYADYTIEWELNDASWNVGHSELSYTANLGNENLIVTVTNNYTEDVLCRIAVVFYRNDEIVWVDSYGALDLEAGEETYLECEFNYSDDYGIIIPDSWEVYIG